MRVALFLGAGASAFVSHPTTKDLLYKVHASINDLGVQDHQRQFLVNLLQHAELDDIEKLYDCLDNMIEIKNYSSVILSNSLYTFHDQQISHSDIVDALSKLKSRVRDILMSSFKIDSEHTRAINVVYDYLWKFMNQIGTNEFRIITTNYDQVIEHYCNNGDWELVNGFTQNQNGLQRQWDNNWTPRSDKHLCLIKLHGSVTWQSDDDGGVIELGMPALRDADSDRMILPTLGPKRYDEAPFSQLIDRFKKTLDNTEMLVVIGFSFRDPEITEIIKDRLRRGLILVSISPTATDTHKIFAPNHKVIHMNPGTLIWKHYRPHVFSCEVEFAPNTVSDLVEYLHLFMADI